jgi:hypothetical protein
MPISGNRQLMGGHVNGRLAATLGWSTTAIMAGAALISAALISPALA